MNSTLFFNQMTCIDHACVIGGKIVGGSILPSIHVTGEVEENEQVVVDFSTLKHAMKDIIDDDKTGFDHKLWVDPNEAGVEFTKISDTVVKIKTEFFEFEGPLDAIKIIDKSKNVGDQIAEELEVALNLLYPTSKISVEVLVATQAAHTLGPHHAFFTYVHGLKNSTSWGCNNLCHGHLSFVEVDGDPLTARMLAAKIASDLNGLILVKKDNIIRETDKSLTIGYDKTLGGRGPFILKFQKDTVPYAVLETETTIENLVQVLTSQYSDEDLRIMGVKHILMSEGLQKGAIRRIPELISPAV